MDLDEFGDSVRSEHNARHAPGEQNDQHLSIDEVWEAIRQMDPVRTKVLTTPGFYLTITEQPAAVRFRYPCEGRSAGSIPGVNSQDPNNKTYTTIELHGYVGQVMVLVSLVTRDHPYRAHPHKLVGSGCVKGICVVNIDLPEQGCEYQFKKVGIQSVTRNKVVESLADRSLLRIDPFRNNFDHIEDPHSIVLTAVRLCFQVFSVEGKNYRSLMRPVVSDIIYDKKTIGLLNILRSSHCSGTARGGTQVIILCDKLPADDVDIVFYCGGWEATATKILVHKQAAIVFETPAYEHPHIAEHVTVQFLLRRHSDDARSNSVPFEYIPDVSGVIKKKRKVTKSIVQNYVHANWTPPSHADGGITLVKQIWDLEKLHITQAMSGTSYGDLAMPGPSHVDLGMPGPSQVDLAMRRPSHVDLVMPGPSHVNLAMPGPGHVDLAMRRPSHVDLAMPGPSHVDLAMPGPSHNDLAMPRTNHDDVTVPGSSLGNQAIPGTSHFDLAMPAGSSQIDQAMVEPNHVDPALSETSYINPATPSQAMLEPFRNLFLH